jgi:hypothetical protein
MHDPAVKTWWVSLTFGVASVMGLASSARAELTQMDLEALGGWQGRNVAQVPNSPPSTRFSIDDVAGSGPLPQPRLQLAGTLGERSE